ncbi:hypothetical protein FRC01_005157 [Tulasnella sp. 417]|nr:hypothetical protein FRC01_005157 [Tulasnella sp. 417]
MSHERFWAITCAIKMIMVCKDNVSETREGIKYELLHQLFECLKTSYEARKSLEEVPFAPEAIRECLQSTDRGKWYATYETRLDLLRHLLGLRHPGSSRPLEPIGALWRDIELDIRRPSIDRSCREELMGHKTEYIGILLCELESPLPRWDIRELAQSLTEVLKYIRAETSVEEPGHPENRVTLELFGLVRDSLREHPYRYMLRGFENEYDRFEAWINMGGCAKSPGRMNRDPECWCSYIEDRFSMSNAKQKV